MRLSHAVLVWAPRALVLAHDLAMAWLAWVALELLRYRFVPGHVGVLFFSPSVAWVVVIQGLIFGWMGLYRGLWRFASLPDMLNIAKASILGAMALALAWIVAGRFDAIPWPLLAAYPLSLLLLVGGPRLLFRAWKDGRRALDVQHPAMRVLIVGAGPVGEALARRMLREGHYDPIGFLDADRRLHGRRLRGVPVLGSVDSLPRIAGEVDADLVAIAIPGASAEQMQTIVAACDQAGIAFRRAADVLHDADAADSLRDVAIEDLLGREAVASDRGALRDWVSGRSILVTGAGGSIGSELCRQLAALDAGALTLIDHDELALTAIVEALRGGAPGLRVHAVLGDCGDRATVGHALAMHGAKAVLHAAAYKHVPALEEHVCAAVRNNVLATRTLAEASLAAGVEDFVLISTDKAVDPANVLGASKRLAEMVCEALATEGLRTAVVRFGNVLDSAGSVVPIFREQIRRGGPVTVTHPEVSRYFMTIPEACELILQAVTMGEDRAVFTLDMGEPVSIRVLAEQMIRLSGRVPGQDVKIAYTGLRPGEKLHERLYHAEEENRMTRHPKIFKARTRHVDGVAVGHQLAALRAAVRECDETRLRHLLHDAVPEYIPTHAAQVVALPVGRRSQVR
ncbi:MAG: polysaccharide biosynthesis protein [Proteobacteria bacterium]|nr:polysaccharide biosynthesis protein [Pseudomonadota bacterium]